MPDYRQSDAAATTWRRASTVLIRNPAQGRGVPSIEFQEENAILIGSELMTVPTDEPGLVCDFSAAGVIPLMNPETGAPIGELTHQQLYIALHSLYIHLATARDARAAAP